MIYILLVSTSFIISIHAYGNYHTPPSYQYSGYGNNAYYSNGYYSNPYYNYRKPYQQIYQQYPQYQQSYYQNYQNSYHIPKTMLQLLNSHHHTLCSTGFWESRPLSVGSAHIMGKIDILEMGSTWIRMEMDIWVIRIRDCTFFARPEDVLAEDKANLERITVDLLI
ncbi:Protein CBG26161 [Caenorhabditis briggsae]|uniref:Protein CBG26161 n=1 Tax=Caenorhabditis briggsae TaxID=6238 RepID=B6IKW4_CAEBR|nr:Protein CBG26161 [Caenorhabditis briggsae]CAS00544.1 Protein CBG26161 [Caenorhabditis briggsae]